RNCRISRAGRVHRSEIAEFHARECSIARKSENFARRSSPPLRNRRILRAGRAYRSGIAESPRAGVVHRSEIVKSCAQEGSIAQELQNPERWRGLALGNREISRAGKVYRSETVEFHAR